MSVSEPSPINQAETKFRKHSVDEPDRRLMNSLDLKKLLRQALAGENLCLDSLSHSLHDMTQIAVALQPGADLAIRNAAMMTPIERASVASVGRGRVLFF